ncbi:ribosomal-processing cysteine protease Prp [Floccifex sp.]|uniref:ribosomal-processing cysteine protease Prp n=1 Tax=Floccifex sp. TaxID=2815810 RepID=UPI003F0785FF
MVKVETLYEQNQIVSIRMNGHANAAKHGEDLVCAGASSIGIGALNALDDIFSDAVDLEFRENKFRIKVLKNSDLLQTCLLFMIKQLETMVEAYPENITIIRKEV